MSFTSDKGYAHKTWANSHDYDRHYPTETDLGWNLIEKDRLSMTIRNILTTILNVLLQTLQC